MVNEVNHNIMNVYVAGSGKMANAILSAASVFTSCTVSKWNAPDGKVSKRAIVLHAGSGRQLEECIQFCRQTHSIMIELSTGLGAGDLVPGFPLVICPNASILVLKAVAFFKENSNYFNECRVMITESHQAAKTSAPGTAYAIAGMLNVPRHEIVSVRDPAVQKNELGIPGSFLGSHAFHRITIEDGTDSLTVETKILGLQSYVKGVQHIIEAVLKKKMENRKYMVWELV